MKAKFRFKKSGMNDIYDILNILSKYKFLLTFMSDLQVYF